MRLKKDYNRAIESDFLGREAIPERTMKPGIRLYLAVLSLSDTVSVLERLGSIGIEPSAIGG